MQYRDLPNLISENWVKMLPVRKRFTRAHRRQITIPWRSQTTAICLNFQHHEVLKEIQTDYLEMLAAKLLGTF
jgi:hypothetical protein